jgi:hypothetical protein
MKRTTLYGPVTHLRAARLAPDSHWQDPERRRAALRAALTAYAGRLRRFYAR